MSNELVEISSFLQAIPPFDLLFEEKLDQVVKVIDICYVRSEHSLPPKVSIYRVYLWSEKAPCPM